MNKDYFPQKKYNKSQKKTTKYQQSHPQQEQEPRFAGISKHEFVNWLKALPAEERYLTLRVRVPELTQKLIELNTKYGSSWKMEIDVKKVPTRFIKNFITSFQNFIDGLILISNKEYLDSIGFDFSFVGCPQKLYETLSNLVLGFHKIRNKNKNPTIEEFMKKIPPEKQEWVCQLVKKIEDDYSIKKKIPWDPLILEKQKNEKKQFGNFWKSLNKTNKINFLYINHQDVKGLVFDLIDQGVKVDPIILEEEINELFPLDRKQICNKVFKCKVKKCSLNICAYYELLYENWREFATKMRNQNYQGHGKKKQKPQNKRQKSLGACSNQTNETELKDSRIEVPQESLYSHIQRDILDCTDQISETSNKFFEKRVLAFERISAIFRLYGVSCRLFGSCANGITIKDSDIDIAVNQDILRYFKTHQDKKSQMNAALQFMSDIFESLPWVSHQKVIKTAAIPIIKLTINTKIEVTEEYFTQQYRQILNRKIQNGGQVNADLTIQTTEQQTSNHLGIVSTQQINTWMEEIPTLRPIIIMLKYHLAKKSLNETYLGGLNTYCLVVLVVSFIYAHQLEKQINVGFVLCKLLNFYGWQFDQKNYGVDLRNKKQIYYQKYKNEQNKFANLQVKDPLNQGKVMTRNCYQFEKIKEIFRQIYENCCNKKEKILKQQLIRAQKKEIKKKFKEQSETQSGSEKERLKNYFIQYIL